MYDDEVTTRLTLPAGEFSNAELDANPINGHMQVLVVPGRTAAPTQNCAKRWLTESWRQKASLKVILSMQTDDCSADAGGHAPHSTWSSSGLLSAESCCQTSLCPGSTQTGRRISCPGCRAPLHVRPAACSHALLLCCSSPLRFRLLLLTGRSTAAQHMPTAQQLRLEASRTGCCGHASLPGPSMTILHRAVPCRG